MPFFFIPLTTLALGSVRPEETASAAGVMSFLRTMAGAIGTSISTSIWDDSSRIARSEIVSRMNTDPTVNAMTAQGFSIGQVRAAVERIVSQESLTLATTHVFLLSAIIFVFAAGIIWFTPRPRGKVDTSAAH